MTYTDFELILEHSTIQILLVILFTMLAQMFVRFLIRRIAHRALAAHKYESKKELKQRHETLTAVFATIIGLMLWIGAIAAILRILEVDIAALATGAGLLGIIVGFGAQNAIKDYLGGIFIIAENQYRVGDIVTLQAAGKETSGLVEDITIRITKLRDLDGNFHIVPNGSIDIVSNLSFQFAQVNIDLDVSYDTDVDALIKVLNAVGENQAKDAVWATNIIDPIAFLRVNDFLDSSIQVKCVGKVKPGKQWEIAGDYRLRIKKEFDKNGIEIPFPQVVVHSKK